MSMRFSLSKHTFAACAPASRNSASASSAHDAGGQDSTAYTAFSGSGRPRESSSTQGGRGGPAAPAVGRVEAVPSAVRDLVRDLAFLVEAGGTMKDQRERARATEPSSGK
jgi:hypothetical protein